MLAKYDAGRQPFSFGQPLPFIIGPSFPRRDAWRSGFAFLAARFTYIALRFGFIRQLSQPAAWPLAIMDIACHPWFLLLFYVLPLEFSLAADTIMVGFPCMLVPLNRRL